ncbi:MAG: phospholipase D family protein, partial [Paracoccaceae bacterium]|nr:phospholipase D family protein [Paracoccaceae bacterium]
MRRLARAARRLTLFGAVAFAALFAARLAFPLPALDGRTASAALPASVATSLGQALLPQAAAHPGLSGVMPLRRGPDALAARVGLARGAEAAIDAQYYIWQRDAAGLLLLDELRRAAERGVRVRLLIDDVGTQGLDAELAALDALDHAEVRLFNPFPFRTARGAAYFFDPARLNRRMHNKSFTVDGIVTVLGGRNVGDIYFARGSEGHYSDFDVLAAGPAAADVSVEFDAYWDSASAYPAQPLLGPPAPGVLDHAAAEASALPGSEAYGAASDDSTLVADLLSGTVSLDWVPAAIVSDDPAKGLGLADSEGLMIARLAEILAEPEARVELISAYFIPGRRGADLIADLARSGIRVRILTNSLEATDVLPVHSGYAEYRDALLAAGVELYELKSATVPREASDHFGVLAAATSSLHAKTLTVDGT